MTASALGWLEMREAPFSLHSGGRSRWLVNAGELYADPAVREAVFACWAAYLEGKGITKFRLVPIPLGGVTWAEGFSEYTQGWRGDQPVIVDDVCTTGGSIAEARVKLGELAAPALVVVRRGGNPLRTCAWMQIELAVHGAGHA